MNQRRERNRTGRRTAIIIVHLLLLLNFSKVDTAAGCLGAGFSVPNILVLENEPYARIWLYRENTNLVQTVDFFTQDGGFYGNKTAKAGIHYASRSGSATFAIGQIATSVDIPLIDNGLMDGSKDLSLIFANPSPGLVLSPVWIRIIDNEIAATVDPLFVPDVPDPAWSLDLTPLPDGRVLVATQERLPTMLQSNGWVDVNFNANIAASFKTGSLSPWKALNDGRILGIVAEADNSRRLVRLLPDGNVEASFVLASGLSIVGVQPNAKFLATAVINNTPVLRRLNSDGSLDASFSEIAFDSLFNNNFQIILVRSNVLTRLNADGRPDEIFAPQPFVEQINHILARRNGAVLVQYGTNLVQLNSDGSVDMSFRLDHSQIPEDTFPHFELDDGHLLSEVSFAQVQSSAIAWNIDGTFDMNYHPDIIGFNPCLVIGPKIGPVESGQILLWGPLETVDGFPRHHLARLLTNPPEREFRVMTPAEFQQSSATATVRVVRTGPTTNSASISFSTRDDTAKADEDYVPQTGALSFAPLEVSKEVVIPLIAKRATLERRFFHLELRNPSSGYTNIPSTPISILPDVHIAADSLAARADGSVSLTLVGTVPGKIYSLESSVDLQHWYITSSPARTASAGTTVFSAILAYNPGSATFVPPIGKLPHFFRALKN